MFQDLQKEIVHHTLGLCRISGQFTETKDITVLGEAKSIAQKIAFAMSMPEATMVLSPPSGENIPAIMRKFTWSVGRLAKACEAFDHFEDFPYRETIQKSVRVILHL